MSLRQISVLCLLLGSAVFQRKPGAPGCRGPSRCQGLMKPALCHSWQKPASSTGSWLRKCPRLCWRQVLVGIYSPLAICSCSCMIFEFEYLFWKLAQTSYLSLLKHSNKCNIISFHSHSSVDPRRGEFEVTHMESQHQDVQCAVHFVFNSKNRRPSRKMDRRGEKKKIQVFAEQAAGTMLDTLRVRCLYAGCCGCLFPGCAYLDADLLQLCRGVMSLLLDVSLQDGRQSPRSASAPITGCCISMFCCLSNICWLMDNFMC